MWIFSNIRDYFGNHVENITTEHVTISDFVLGNLTVLDVVEYDDEDNGLGYSIEVAETVTKGLIKVRTATALGRGYYSIGSVTPVFSAEWSAYVCVTEEPEFTAAWSAYVCATEEEPVPETLSYPLTITWVDTTNNGATDGLGGTVVLKDNSDVEKDSSAITLYSKSELITLSATDDGTGFKVDMSGIKAYVAGVEVVKDLTWSLSSDMTNPQSTAITPIYNASTNIYIEINTV